MTRIDTVVGEFPNSRRSEGSFVDRLLGLDFEVCLFLATTTPNDQPCLFDDVVNSRILTAVFRMPSRWKGHRVEVLVVALGSSIISTMLLQ